MTPMFQLQVDKEGIVRYVCFGPYSSVM